LDALAGMMMKGAVKCDKHIEEQLISELRDARTCILAFRGYLAAFLL